jgi:hypothetical protein
MKTEGMYDPLKVLIFHNITKDVFEGKWNGRIRVFQPGEKASLTEYLAEHYCKQLIDTIVGKEFDKAGKNAAKIKEAEQHYINESYHLELEKQILSEARFADEEDIMLIKAKESKQMVDTAEKKEQLARLGDKSKVVRMGDHPSAPTMVVLNQNEESSKVPAAFSEL